MALFLLLDIILNFIKKKKKNRKVKVKVKVKEKKESN
jgi:preprotein translocase subunit SecG